MGFVNFWSFFLRYLFSLLFFLQTTSSFAITNISTNKILIAVTKRVIVKQGFDDLVQLVFCIPSQ